MFRIQDSDRHSGNMDVDEALNRLGKWGKWQMVFYLLLSIADTFPAAWHMLAIVFIGGIPDHHCKLASDISVEAGVPISEETGNPERCIMYVNRTLSNATQECQDGWVYTGDVGPTIVTLWDLVCDNDYLVETSQTVMVIGVMVGAMFFTALSDNYGRKPVFLFSQWAMVVIGVITAFCTNYYLFSVLRFLAGALQQGIILTGFVMACELFPAENRTFAGMAIENFWATGMCLLALFSYLIRDWRYVQLLISIPGVLTIAFYWILPESLPWLVANNRVDEAEEILQNAAKWNKVDMPERILPVPVKIQDDTQTNIGNHEEAKVNGKKGLLEKIGFKKKKKEQTVSDVAHYTLLDVLKNAKLRLYAIIMCLLWFVNSLVYYGLSLSTSALAGNGYLNFFLSGLVEIPAYTSCIFILQKWGRRWPLAIFHIVAGIFLCLSMFIPKETADGTSLVWLLIICNMIGKFGITGSFGTVFLYAPEIFPTTLRSQAMGISSLGGRLGNMLAPFSSLVARNIPWLPGILFGTSSIIVGCLALLLPETLNRPLPQTIEDIENWSKKPQADDNQHELDDLPNDVKEVPA